MRLAGILICVAASGCHLVFSHQPRTDGSQGDGGRGDLLPIEGGAAEAGRDGSGPPKPPLYQVSPDGWGLRAPLFHHPACGGGDPYCSLAAIWGLQANDLWLIGAGGRIARNTGGGWRPVISPTTNGLNAIWGASAGVVWFVGDQGTLLRYASGALTLEPSPAPEDLLAMAGAAANQIWIGGRDGLLLEGNGKIWKQLIVESASHYDLFLDAQGAVHVTGNGQVSTLGGSGGVENVPGAKLLRAIWGSGTLLWAGDRGTDDGQIFRRDAGGWKLVRSGVAIEAIWGRSEQELWAVGYQQILHSTDQGATWKSEHQDLQRTFFGVFGPPASPDVYAPASGGNLFLREGSAWKRIALGDPYASYRAVRRASGETWIAGSKLYRERGKGLEPIEWSGAPLRGVHVEGGEVWAVGGDAGGGVIVRVVGAQLEDVTAAAGLTPAQLNAIWGTSGGILWACGNGGVLYQRDPSVGGWTPVVSPTTKSLQALWGSSSNELWAAGDDGVVLRGQGSSWQPVESGTSERLLAIGGSGPKDVWFVGEKGTAVRWNGSAIVPASPKPPTLPGEELRAVWVSPGGKVWLAASESGSSKSGRLLQLDGAGWRVLDVGTSKPFNALHGSAADDLWAVGLEGVIAHAIESPR